MKRKKENKLHQAFFFFFFFATRYGSAKLSEFQESNTSLESSGSKHGDFVWYDDLFT